MTRYRRFLPYGVAIASTAIALLLSIWLNHIIDRMIASFFYIAIAVTAWYGGTRPGLVAIVLSGLSLNYFFMPPLHHFHLKTGEDSVRLLLFSTVALIITLLSRNLQESRKQVEQLNRRLMAESADRLQTALHSAQMGMWEWNLNTGEVVWSPEHEQLFGLPIGSFDGNRETADACVHPEDRASLQQAIAQALQEKTVISHEYRILWADGSIHWIECRGQAFYTNSGRPTRMSGTVMAIDQRKQAEITLQERESLLRIFAQHAPAGIAMFDQEMRYIMASQQWIDDYNLESLDAIIHRSHYEIFPEIPDRWRQIHQRCLAGAIEKCDDDLFIRANATEQWVSWEIRPWYRAIDKIGGIIIFAVDVTQRKQAEEALRQSAARLHLAQVASNSAVWDWDVAANTVIWSPEYYQLYQLHPSIKPSYENWLNCVHPDDRATADQQTLQTLEQQSTELRVEFRVVQSGKTLWFADIGQVFRDANGKAIRVVGITIDMTQQKQNELKLQALTAELEQRVAGRTAELQKTNNLLQNFFNASSSAEIGLCIHDPELRFVQINEALAAFNGYPVEAHLGKTTSELLPDLAPTINPLLQQVLATGQPILNLELSTNIHNQADEMRYWLVSYFPISHRNDSSRPAGVGVIVLEISDRKRAETALQQYIREIEDLYNNAPCGYHSLDAEGRFVRINNTELNWLGYTRDELLHQKTLFDLLASNQEEIFDEFTQFKQRGWANNLEIQLVRKDGSTCWFNLNSTAARDEAGNFLMTRSTVFDIRDRKRIEAERHQVEMALRHSEEKFRQLAENIEAVFWMCNAQDFQVIYVSPAYEAIWQQSCESLYCNFNSWLESIHIDDRDRVETAFQQFPTKGHYDQEYRIVRPDNTMRWIRDRAFAIRDEQGILLRIAGLAEDFTDRKQAEAALQQQNRLNQLRWNITQSIRQSLDLQAILSTTVEQMRQTLQVDRVAVYRFQPDWSGNFIAESVGADWVKLLDLEALKDWKDTYLQETQGGRFQAHEMLVITDRSTANLQPCHVELLERLQAKAYAAAPIFSGTTLWGLLAIYQNATPRDWQNWEIELLQQIASQLAIAIQQSELYSQLQLELQERLQTEAFLREAERRWRSMLNSVQLIVVGLDQKGQINYVNPFFLTLTGYTEAEVLGQDWFQTFVPPSRQHTIQTIFSEVINQNIHPYYQNSILTKMGEERFIAWNNTWLQDVNGTVIGTISIGEDITERQKIEKIKDEFIGIVSHELRTPLTAIQMSLGLLKTGIYAQKPEKAHRMIEIALIDTNRLVNLVNDILDLERLESGRTTLEKAVCDTADLMQQAVDGMQAIAKQHSIKLEIATPPAKVWAAADTIIQTLTNLLSNAIKFSPANSTIYLQAEHQADCVLFQVKDQGRGIPDDKLETIFGRFQQVDVSDSREKGGTGLGLPICRSIIERHGGKIWAESILGEGSTFFFTLPIPPNNNL